MRRYGKHGGAARRRFFAIRGKPVGVVKMTPSTRAKVKGNLISVGNVEGSFVTPLLFSKNGIRMKVERSPIAPSDMGTDDVAMPTVIAVGIAPLFKQRILRHLMPPSTLLFLVFEFRSFRSSRTNTPL